jgi:zinc protease
MTKSLAVRASGPFTAFALALAASSLAATTARAGELDLPVRERTLDNGLKVLVLEDRSIPNVAMYVWWRVGARNERTGITGLAHFFEHMMFMGGAKYGARFDPVMEAAGGSNNAYTSHDVTVYQDWIPASALPLVLDMERDRMSGMVFAPEKVQSERDVVTSEYRLGMEDPHERLAVQLRAAAYTVHPYQWDVIGWYEDIRSWRQADLEAFYDANYAPNNATFVIVGAVDPEETFRAVAVAMGGIPRKPDRLKIHSAEPEQKGERRVVFEAPDAQTVQVLAAWHMCATGDDEFPVFEVLEDLLLDGDASRLRRLLVEEGQLCLDVSGGWQGHQFDPSLFTVELTLRDGVEPAKAETRVHEELARLAREGPGERELRRVKNKIRAEFVRQLRTIDGKAALLGETETFFGGWRNLSRRVERVAAVTADDVKRVAAKTFRPQNRTVATLVIPEAGAPAPGEEGGGGRGGDR